MKDLLKQLGIDELDSFVYEYEPIKLDWWDSEYNTSIEIETHETESGSHEIRIIFCPESEGVVERAVVFATILNNGFLEETLLEKKLYEMLFNEKSFQFLSDQNAYQINSASKAKNAFLRITELILNKSPFAKFDLKESEDDDIGPAEPGDTLDHFLAMMHMNSIEFTKENIVEYIEMSIDFEGPEYLVDLQSDVTGEIPDSITEDYNLDEEILNLIKSEIINYVSS